MSNILYNQNASPYQIQSNQQLAYPQTGQTLKMRQQQARNNRIEQAKSISDEEDDLADVIDSSDDQAGISAFKSPQISKSNNKTKFHQQDNDPNHQLELSQSNAQSNFLSPYQNASDRQEFGFRKNIEFTSGNKNFEDDEEVKYAGIDPFRRNDQESQKKKLQQMQQFQQYDEGSFSQQQYHQQYNSFQQPQITDYSQPQHRYQEQKPGDTVNIDLSRPGDEIYTYNKKTDDHIRELYGNKVAQSRSQKTSQQLTNPAFSRGSQRSAQKQQLNQYTSIDNSSKAIKQPSNRYQRSPQVRSSNKSSSSKYPQQISKSTMNSPVKRKTNTRALSNEIEQSQPYYSQEQDPVYTRLYQHSKHLQERKHIKKLTQNIYEETSQMKEVKHKPTVNDNSQKFAKRKQMYRLGTEPIQNALYRDFIYREKRKQDQLNQVHAQLNADINRQKTNSKSYKLALKKLEKDLQDVFRECNLDPTGHLSYQSVAIVISKIGVFKVHGNPLAIQKLEEKARNLAQGIGPEASAMLSLNSLSGSVNNILLIANSCNKKAAGNAIVQTQQRREREKQLHLQLWRYLNPQNLNQIQSVVLIEFFKVILCQFTQSVKELASTVSELMNIAHSQNKANQHFHLENQEQQDPFSNNGEQDLSAIPMYNPINSSHQYQQEAQDFAQSPPPIPAHLHQQQHLQQHLALSNYPPEPQTQSQSNDEMSNHARNPSGSHFSRVSNNSSNNAQQQQQISSTSMAAQQILGEHGSPIASPDEIDQFPQSVIDQQQLEEQQQQLEFQQHQLPHSHRVAQLSGIPEETIISNQGGSGLGSRIDDQRDLLSAGQVDDLVESPNSQFGVLRRGGGELSTQGISNTENGMPEDADEHQQWNIELILKEIKSLNEGTLILKRPDKRLSQSGMANSQVFLRQSKQQWMKQIQGLEQSRQLNDLPTDMRKEVDQYTFKPKINAKSKHIKSKLKQMLLAKQEVFAPPQPAKLKDEVVQEKKNINKQQSQLQKSDSKKKSTSAAVKQPPSEIQKSPRLKKGHTKGQKSLAMPSDVIVLNKQGKQQQQQQLALVIHLQLEKIIAKRPTTYRHNKLLQAREQYDKKLKQKQQMKEKQILQSCTFKPSINQSSKKLESRFSQSNRSLSPEKQPIKIDGIDINQFKGQSKQSSTKHKTPSVRQSLPRVGEYLNCTFKPSIMGSKFNKNILKKRSVAPKGTQDAAKRMRQAFQEKEKIKNYLQSMKLGENYQKNKNLKSKPPVLKTTQRAAKQVEAPIIFLDVNVGPGKTGRLVLKKNQPLSEAANQFAKIYHLNDYMKLSLIQMLQEQYNEYILEQEQLQEEQNQLASNNITPNQFQTPTNLLTDEIKQSDMKSDQVPMSKVAAKSKNKSIIVSQKSESQADIPLFEDFKVKEHVIQEEKEISNSADYKQNQNLNTGETVLDTQQTRNSQTIAKDAFDY